MKLKKLVSICLVGAMAATLLAGCGSSNETVGEEIKDDAEEVVEDVKDVAEDVGEGVKDAAEDVGEDVKDAAEEAVDDVKENAEEAKGEDTESSTGSFAGFEGMVDITVYGFSLFPIDGFDEVIDAANEIVEDAINVHLDFTLIEASAYAEQMSLMFASADPVDLIMCGPLQSARYSNLQAQGSLMDISGYVYEYAPDAMEVLGDYVKAMSVGDAIYGLPDYQNINSSLWLCMRKDILDELGLTEDARAVASWDDVEAIFEAVYDAQDSLPQELQTSCIIGNSSNDGSVITIDGADDAANLFSDMKGYDALGNPYKVLATFDDGVVQNWYATDDFRAIVDRVRDWYTKGWVYKDSANSQDSGQDLIRGGVAFCYTASGEMGTEANTSRDCGQDMVCVPICKIPVQTSGVNTWGWAVPVQAEEPEAAVAFLNLLYTDEELVNLFVYGIEGRDYELNDEGEAVILDDGRYQSSDSTWGNQFLSYPAEGNGGNFREESLADMDTAVVSPFFGCSIDHSEVADEFTAVANVVDKYVPGLVSGSYDPDDNFDDMLADMESAGIQIVIDYYQQELDAWLAEQ